MRTTMLIFVTLISVKTLAAELCQSLSVGSKFVVDEQDVGTSLGAHYTLLRTSEKQYVAEFNVKFIAGEAFRGDPTAVESDFRKRISDCFEQLNPRMTDGNGTFVSFRLAQPSDEAITIEVGGKSGNSYFESRANERNFTQDITCPTVMHEFLHHTGLVDTYSEKYVSYFKPKIEGDTHLIFEQRPPAEIPAYDCRRTEDSIMSNQYQAVGMGYEFCDRLVCTCDDDARLCKLSEIKDNQDKCPSGTTEHRQRGAYSIRCPVTNGWRASTFPVYLELVKKAESQTPPLLNTNKMNLILFPGCKSINNKYYSCASNAYRTSIKNGGNGCFELPDALNCGESL